MTEHGAGFDLRHVLFGVGPCDVFEHGFMYN